MVHSILNTNWLHVRTKIRYTWMCRKLGHILEPTQLINFKVLLPKSGIFLRFNLSGVLCGRDQAWAHTVAFNTIQTTLLNVFNTIQTTLLNVFNTIQTTLLNVFKLAGAKTINVLSVKLYIHRVTTVLTLLNCPVADLVHRYAPHNDVLVNDGPHIRRWSHNFIIL
jgi:hypothetical protein